MRSAPYLFDRLQADLDRHLRHRSTVQAARRWAASEPALAGIRTALDAAGRCRDRNGPGGGRPALAALVRLADGDRLAADAALFGVLPALRATAIGLCRAWAADPDEIDQEVAAAGWARLTRVAGQTLGWPDRTIADGARVTVRDRLRASARVERRLVALPDTDTQSGHRASPAGAAEETVEAADLLTRAVHTGAITARAAGLVWATRVAGVPPAEAGVAVGCSAKAATMTCLRAESTLRQSLADAA